MRRGLFKKQKFSAAEKFHVELEERVARLGDRFKLDDRLALAVPSTMKTNLRLQKQRTGVSMSRQVRQKLEVA
jgi:LDH2 family malate/lactate/ureidoglycolate dehydrogenase